MSAAPEVVERILDNGLRVLLAPMHAAPLASVWCWYHVGSKDEAPGTTGASHWVEHMNFKGTSGISREDIKVWIERAGGMWNGYTWIDQTTYFETLAADALDLALQIESERMTGCVYDPEEFESERTVIISELQGNENNPAYVLGNEVAAAAFRAHPYGWPTIGWLSDLETMQRDDLYQHYRRYYVPDNATLVVAGDVDTDQALQ
ncbi:MAG: pitrilysin family protein, partial [Acidobacteriota bacterium]